MSKEKSDQDDPDLKAIVEWEPTPDAEARWAAAMESCFLIASRKRERIAARSKCCFSRSQTRRGLVRRSRTPTIGAGSFEHAKDAEAREDPRFKRVQLSPVQTFGEDDRQIIFFPP
jgi:hypothetical protein